AGVGRGRVGLGGGGCGGEVGGAGGAPLRKGGRHAAPPARVCRWHRGDRGMGCRNVARHSLLSSRERVRTQLIVGCEFVMWLKEIAMRIHRRPLITAPLFAALLFAASALPAGAQSAPDASGHWQGTVQARGTE